MILTAEQAKRLSLEYKLDDIKKINDKIMAACKNGMRYAIISDASQKTVKVLIEFGYKVRQSGSLAVVSW